MGREVQKFFPNISYQVLLKKNSPDFSRTAAVGKKEKKV